MTIPLARWLVVVAMAASLAGCAGGPVRSASPAPASVATVSSLPPGFPLGAWVVTITEQDLLAGGLPNEPGLLGENSGKFTKTYAPDGTWTVVQEAAVPLRAPVFRGTFRASGPNEIEETTTFPPDYAGDVVRYTWAREGSGVRFRVVNPPDPLLPVLTETHPWQPA